MTDDVQVSNARRIGFTALAVVTLWVMAWGAYRVGWSNGGYAWAIGWASGEETGRWYDVPSLAIVPLILLSLSIYDHPIMLRDPWVLGFGLLVLASLGFGCWLGRHNAGAHYASTIIAWPDDPRARPDPWLLTPILLTTAFVIFGAWRRAVQESRHEREGIDNKYFRVLTGLVGLVALLYVAVHKVTFILDNLQIVQFLPLMFWIVIATPLAGWGLLVYACWIRSGRITETAVAFVLGLGVLGMAITFLAATTGQPDPPNVLAWAIVIDTGIWILNGLGIVWIVNKVRRIRAASNTE